MITRYEVVERLYLRTGSSVQVAMNAAVIQLYTSILEYLLEARKYFTQRFAARIAKSIFQLEDMTTKSISKIKSKQSDVDQYVRLVSGEFMIDTSYAVNQLTHRIRSIDVNVRDLRDSQRRAIDTKDIGGLGFQKMQRVLQELNEPITRIATRLSMIEDGLKAEERLKIFDWLSSVHYTSHHRSKSSSLLPESGEWLLRKPKFIEWLRSSSSSILWLHGIPGCGKSMLIAHVIEYLQARSSLETSPAPIAYFYCARNSTEPERADPEEVLRCILEQLSTSDEDQPVREPVVKAYLSRKKEARGRKPERLGLLETVQTILELLEANPAIIVIDGLDECDPMKRQALLNGLRTIIRKSKNLAKVLISSRDDHDLVYRLSKTPNLYIHATDNMEDIRKFVVSRVGEAITDGRLLCGKVSSELHGTIIDILIQKAEGMFRLVSLHIQTLCDPYRIKTAANVLDALTHLPQDLTESYASILAQINNSQDPNPKIAESVMKWMLCAQEALDAETFMIAVSPEVSCHTALQRSDILSICSNLVVYDKYADTFRFAHLSVQEYLQGLECYSPSKCNSLAAELCLSWLLSPDARISRAASSDDFEFESGSESYFKATKLFRRHVDFYWASYCERSSDLSKESRLRTLLHNFLGLPTPRPPLPTLQERQVWWDWVIRMRTDLKHHFQSPKAPELPLLGDTELPFYEDQAKIPLKIESQLQLSLGWHSIFVACAFGLSDTVAFIVQNELLPPSVWHRRNLSGINCAQVAARCDQTEVIAVLLKEGKKYQLADAYWLKVLLDCTAHGNFGSLYAVLSDHGGGERLPGTNFAINVLVRAALRYYNPGGILEILFRNGTTGPLNKSSTRDGLGRRFLIPQLREVEDESRRIASFLSTTSIKSKETVGNILQESSIFVKVEILTRLLKTFNYTSLWEKGPEMDVSVFRLKACQALEKFVIHCRQAARQDDVHGKLFLLGIYAYATEIDIEDFPSKLLVQCVVEDSCFTTPDLVTFKGSKLVLLYLRMQSKIPDSCVKAIISYWDVEAVKYLLTFRKIRVTKDVIRAAVMNVEYGSDIMQLLLDKELEEQGLTSLDT